MLLGVDGSGERIAEGPTFSDDFKDAAKGRWFKVIDSKGAIQHWCLKVWLVAFCGDYPQSQGMGPWMEAVGAYVPCRGCDYRVDASLRHETVHSFFEPDAKWQLRNRGKLMPKIRQWRQCSCSQEMRDSGVNKLHWALAEEYFPDINFASITPQDIMHLFADGITRHEAAWLLYMLHSRGHLKVAAANEAIRRYKWARDCRVPQLPSAVEDGATGRYPRVDATIGMSASQTFTFAMHRFIQTLLLLLAASQTSLVPLCVCVQCGAPRPSAECSCKADTVLALVGGARAPAGDGAALYVQPRRRHEA